jgi:superfamily II RNA helicase
LNDTCYAESRPISSLIVDFLKTLQEKKLLPCIVFSDNRRLCEQMAESAVKYLEEFEREQRETKYKEDIKQTQKRLI